MQEAHSPVDCGSLPSWWTKVILNFKGKTNLLPNLERAVVGGGCLLARMHCIGEGNILCMLGSDCASRCSFKSFWRKESLRHDKCKLQRHSTSRNSWSKVRFGKAQNQEVNGQALSSICVIPRIHEWLHNYLASTLLLGIDQLKFFGRLVDFEVVNFFCLFKFVLFFLGILVLVKVFVRGIVSFVVCSIGPFSGRGSDAVVGRSCCCCWWWCTCLLRLVCWRSFSVVSTCRNVMSKWDESYEGALPTTRTNSPLRLPAKVCSMFHFRIFFRNNVEKPLYCLSG